MKVPQSHDWRFLYFYFNHNELDKVRRSVKNYMA